MLCCQIQEFVRDLIEICLICTIGSLQVLPVVLRGQANIKKGVQPIYKPNNKNQTQLIENHSQNVQRH